MASLQFASGTTGRAASLSYRFFNADGSWNGAAVTSSIAEVGTTGTYVATSVTIPTNAVGVYWADSGITTNYASESVVLTDASISSKVIAASAYQGIVDSVLDELISGHLSAGTVGKSISDAATAGGVTVEDVMTTTTDGMTATDPTCMVNMIRLMLNKKTQRPGYIDVYLEDGTTVAFSIPVTTAVSPATPVVETAAATV